MLNRGNSVPVGTTVDVLSQLQACLDEVATDPMVPSVQVAVLAPHLGVDWQGSARGTLASIDDKVCAETPFRIASVSKLHVACAVWRLIEDGFVSPNDSLKRYLTSSTLSLLKRFGHDAELITVAHLLAHTSGLADHASDKVYADTVQIQPQRVWTRKQQIEWGASLPALGQPGQVFHYSDTGFVLLGELIEVLCDGDLGDAVKRLLDFEALGLNQTQWESTDLLAKTKYSLAPQWLGVSPFVDAHPSFDLFGGGGLISTVADLVRFTRALFRGLIFQRDWTMASACIVPQASRQSSDHLHSHLGMVLPLGPTWAWGHYGFWGSGVVCCPWLDITLAFTFNQARPSMPHLRADFPARLGAILVDASRQRVGGKP